MVSAIHKLLCVKVGPRLICLPWFRRTLTISQIWITRRFCQAKSAAYDQTGYPSRARSVCYKNFSVCADWPMQRASSGKRPWLSLSWWDALMSPCSVNQGFTNTTEVKYAFSLKFFIVWFMPCLFWFLWVSESSLIWFTNCFFSFKVLLWSKINSYPSFKYLCPREVWLIER